MNLKPIRMTANIPAELEPLIKQRMAEEHYRSQSAYLLGLVLFDLVARCRHKLTSQMLNEPQAMLDKVVSEIVRDFDLQPRQTGEWLKHRISELMEEQRDAANGYH